MRFLRHRILRELGLAFLGGKQAFFDHFWLGDNSNGIIFS